MAELTAKQARFVDEYLIDLNATQAAIRAGYSAKTANEIGAENLAKPSIRAAVAKRQQVISERISITQDYVLGTIRETIERCRQAAPVLDRAGKQVYIENPDGDVVPAYGFDPKAVLKGCELLGQHLALFKTVHQGALEVTHREIPLDKDWLGHPITEQPKSIQ